MKLLQKLLFAFDIGTNSIGWSVFGLDKYLEPASIIDAGVRIFSDGREPKSGTSLAEGRRMARAMSRRRDRYKRRRKAVLRTLIEYGLMPEDERARKALVAETNDRKIGVDPLDVYALRANALDHKLPLYHLGRALFHLNQRRGFKSNRKTDTKDNDQGKIAIGISRLQAAMDMERSRTLGEFLMARRAAGFNVRVRADSVIEPNVRRDDDEMDGYGFYPERGFLEREFGAIWNAQAAHYPDDLTEERREHLFRVMFYQRPLKAVLVGKCSFNPDEFRLAKAHPLFQSFRLYKEINELGIVFPDQSVRKLTLEQRDLIYLKLRTVRKGTYAGLRKLLKLPPNAVLNKESESRKDMVGDEVTAALSDAKTFGQGWFDLDIDRQWAFVSKLRETEEPDVLRHWLQTEHGFNDERAEAIAGVHLPEGYGRLGQTALLALRDELISGTQKDEFGRDVVIPEAEAAKRTGYDHALSARGEGVELLPKYQEILSRSIPPGTGRPEDPYDIEMGRITNPTVHIGLNQLQQVINTLIARFGKPEQIAVELARDLKLSDEQKKEVNKTITQNTRAAQGRSQLIKEINEAEPNVRNHVRDNGHNRQLLKLWERLGNRPEDRICVYTGKRIGISMLFSGEVDIDHILPWSQTLDDGQSNRILCMSEANRFKGNRAPAEVAWPGGYDEVLERANRLPDKNQRWRFARDAMKKFDGEKDFLARQLTDTQYLSRLSHQYLDALYPDEEPDEWGEIRRRNHVRVIPGRLTSMLRRHWGLDSIISDHNAKNRSDHRHHAIDAAVVAATTRSLLQRIASEANVREAQPDSRTIDDLPPPWPSFRDDLKAVIDTIVVSHKPDHGQLPGKGKSGKTAGQLHNDTAYGITGETDAKGNTIVVRRKPFSGLTEKDLPSIRDTQLRDRLSSATNGLVGNDFKAALMKFAAKDQVFGKIRHVRLVEPLKVIGIRDRDGKIYKGYKGDANYRFDVWELKDGKWVAEVVTMFDAHQPDWTSQVHAQNHNSRKVLSLHQNDMVAYEHPAEGYTIGRVVKFNSAGQLIMAANREGGSLKARDADKEDPFKYFYKSGDGLKDVKLRQVRIDATGQVFDPGAQDAQSKLERKQKLQN